MPATIERPVFQEGQILGADDLGLLLDYGRDQQARHARCAHLWGIAEGLDAKIVSNNLQVAPGIAVDSSGAAIVLTDPVTVTQVDFTGDLSQGEDTGTYPLFLLARQDETAIQSFASSCGGAAGSHVQESGRLRFGRASDLVGWDTNQAQPAVAIGPDDAPGTRRVLLGFVDWDTAGKKFTAFKKEYQGFRPRYLGVRAETVESASGQFIVRIKSDAVKDIALVKVNVQDPKNLFAFGLDNGLGDLNPLLTVDKDGNVTAKGAIKGGVAAKPGEVYVQSGQATDGICLPLPAGFTLDQVKDGTLNLHTVITPRPEESEPPDPGQKWIATIKECDVDRDTLQVKCVFDWLPITNLATPTPCAGTCDYLLIVTVNSSLGGGA